MVEVTPVPCLKDNYAYLVRPAGAAEALVVDASEAAPVEAALSARGLRLAGILTTHHHHDHVGGNQALAAARPGLPIYGFAGDRDRIPGLTHGLTDGERFTAAGLDFRVLHIPGHTLGAIAYLVEDAVFTGDTLFGAGCGRLFEGTPEMMHESLNLKLAALPDTTRVFCGHEYTAANLRFAAHIDPDNPAIAARRARVEAQRERGEPTVPSTLGEEKATNPFLRVDSAAAFARVRKAKDVF